MISIMCFNCDMMKRSTCRNTPPPFRSVADRDACEDFIPKRICRQCRACEHFKADADYPNKGICVLSNGETFNQEWCAQFQMANRDGVANCWSAERTDYTKIELPVAKPEKIRSVTVKNEKAYFSMDYKSGLVQAFSVEFKDFTAELLHVVGEHIDFQGVAFCVRPEKC